MYGSVLEATSLETADASMRAIVIVVPAETNIVDVKVVVDI